MTQYKDNKVSAKNEEHPYKNYWVPKRWVKLDENHRKVLYKISESSKNTKFESLVYFYLLSAYDKSPLHGGTKVKGKRLAKLMRKDGHNFTA